MWSLFDMMLRDGFEKLADEQTSWQLAVQVSIKQSTFSERDICNLPAVHLAAFVNRILAKRKVARKARHRGRRYGSAHDGRENWEKVEGDMHDSNHCDFYG
jgi:hypothetical protein